MSARDCDCLILIGGRFILRFSMFLSAGELGLPLDSSSVGKMLNCIQGNTDNYVAALESAGFDRKLPTLRSHWTNARYEKMQEIIHNQVLVNGLYLQLPESISLPEGTTVFRARSVSASIEYGTEYIDQDQLWEPPQKCVTNFGRLNKPGESYLYVNCADPAATLDEARVNVGDNFALIAYEVVRPINAIGIGVYIPPEASGVFERSPAAFEQYCLLHEYLHQEFSRPLESADEVTYQLSNAIVDEFYSYESCVAYNPVDGGRGINLRINPDVAHDNLAIRGVYFGSCSANKFESMISDYGRWHYSSEAGRYLCLEHAKNPVHLNCLFFEDELVCRSIDCQSELYSFTSYRPSRRGHELLTS